MCSRGRPLQLTGALLSLHDNESGDHDVKYAVAVDVDDKATIGTLVSLQAKIPIGYRVGERPVSLDALHNQLTKDIPADVYVCFIDDALCLTKDWDVRIAELYEEDHNGLWWWTPKGDELTMIPIMSKGFYKAAGNKIFPEYFPFWWGDTWLSEVYMLATESHLKFAPIEVLDCPKDTMGMRELRFWHNFYLWLQPERIAEAKKLAEKLDLPEPTIAEDLRRIIGAPNKSFVEDIDRIEAMQGDQGEPHEGYKTAKANAVAMMEGNDRPMPSFDIVDLLTPEVIAVLDKHFPETIKAA